LIKNFSEKFSRGFVNRQNLLQKSRELVESTLNRRLTFQLPIRILESVLKGLEENDSALPNVSLEYPSWSKPVVKIWRFTFRPREMRYSFGQVLRRSAVQDIKSLVEWASEKFERNNVYRLMEERKVTAAAAPLYGKKYQNGGFTLTFLQEIKQEEVLVGRLANMTDSLIWFDNGDRCWKTDNGRAFKLELICNDRNTFLSASESSTCVYEGVFATPIACTQTAQFDNYTLKALEKLAAIYKLPPAS
jgi:hypothetical protein